MTSAPQNLVQINGQTQVSDGYLNTLVQWCPNVSTLRTFVGSGTMSIYLEGTTTPNDGGQGQFYWNSTGTATDDNGVTTVVPNGIAQGCWTRLGSATTSVSSITNSDGSLTISPTTGNAVANLSVSLTASTVFGKNSSGAYAAIPFNTIGVAYSVISGCLPSSITGTNTTASMTVSAGQAADSTNAILLTSAGYSWAASNGNAINGTDAASSTLANSTTYHMYLISGASGTGTFCSASLTPTLPTGYNTYKRRIFSFNTFSNGSPVPYVAVEVEGGAIIAWLGTQILDINVTNLGSASRTLYTLTVPTGIKVQPIGRASGGTNSTFIILTSGDETDVAPTGAGSGLFTTTPGADLFNNGSSFALGLNAILTTNTSGQIGARANTTSVSWVWVTRGFKDFRRS
jgi:hypothetical protein